MLIQVARARVCVCADVVRVQMRRTAQHPNHFHNYRAWVLANGHGPFPGYEAASKQFNLVDAVRAVGRRPARHDQR